MKCVFELQSRTKMRDPIPCGEPATWYRIFGQIASVQATLCMSHAEVMRSRGYRLVLVESTQERIAS